MTSDLPTSSGGTDGGTSPALAGKASVRYGELLACVRETLAPADVLEQLWMRDIVDLAWEAMELRKLKADLLKAAEGEGMKRLLEQFTHDPGGHKAKRWANRDADALRWIEPMLARAGMTADHVAASTFAARIADFERIERMIAATEVRRNAALRELDRYRATFAARLRQTLAAVENVEEAVPAIPTAAA
jgi:hypothetical protein